MLFTNIKIYDDLSDEEVMKLACKKNKVDISKVKTWEIVKKSVDARNKLDVHYDYTIRINEKIEEFNKEDFLVHNKKRFDNPIVIIGAGPAGLFATYVLAINGYNPILLEQGKCIDERIKDVEAFLNDRILNERSNVQFGEGGAGAFSDGKLTTNVNSEINRIILKTFIKYGAPKEIMYLSKPHIGTDILRNVIKNMRIEMENHGAMVRFNTKVTDFDISNEQLNGIVLENGEYIKTNNAILAIGHSARSTFQKLLERKTKMEPKAFSMGFRIEHLQSMINKSQYGTETKLNLPPAEYKLVYHDEDTGRTCYTFCMCPGGEVIASSSENGTIVTNGMSNHKRDGKNANSAILVNVVPSDFMIDANPLNGLLYQKKFEEKAFVLGGSNYNAPIQAVGDYLNKQDKEDEIVIPSYKPGTKAVDLHSLYPNFINDTIEKGLLFFDSKINGFANNNAILTGPETRSSSPVRILRDDNYCANIKGIYPCGEGAGYAGGIMTASVDGFKVAKKLIEI